jgi:hypothetical protein
VITPLSPVYVHKGGEILFSASCNDKKCHNSKWVSLDTDIVSIDSQSGNALAKNEGVANVEYRHLISHKAKVHVLTISDICLDNVKFRIMTNIKEDPNYR